jgi:hypothetical protein
MENLDSNNTKNDNNEKNKEIMAEVITEIITTKPEDFIPLAYKLIYAKKYEESIELINKAIELKLKSVNEDRNHIEMARFYVVNADILIIKLQETTSLFEGLDQNKNGNHEEKKEKNLNGNFEDHKKRTNDDSDNEYDGSDDDESEEATDEEIIYDNLFTAQKLYQEYLRPYNTQIPEDIPEEIRKIYVKLAGVFSLFGELEIVKNDNKKAIHFYEEGLTLYKKYTELFSRNKGECYYKLSFCYDFDPYKSFVCFFLTKIIMELHLQKLMDEENEKSVDQINKKYYKKIYNPEEKIYLENGNVNELKIDLDCVELKFKEVQIVDEIDKNEDIIELKSILQELYTKVSFFNLNVNISF